MVASTRQSHVFGFAVILVLLFAPSGYTQDLARLRVLTYNIHHGQGSDGKFDLERLAKIIASVKPDIVALQEVDRRTRRAKGVDQVVELGRLTGMHAEFGKAIDFSGGEYGTAILAKVKPVGAKVHTLPREKPSEARAALAVRFKAANDLPELIVVGTHLCDQHEINRVAQAKAIDRLYGGQEGPPVLLVGDLNAYADSDTLKELGKQWTDTLPMNRTIDYVLTRKCDSWRVVETKVLNEPVASDHDPVLVVLEWKGAR